MPGLTACESCHGFERFFWQGCFLWSLNCGAAAVVPADEQFTAGTSRLTFWVSVPFCPDYSSGEINRFIPTLSSFIQQLCIKVHFKHSGCSRVYMIFAIFPLFVFGSTPVTNCLHHMANLQGFFMQDSKGSFTQKWIICPHLIMEEFAKCLSISHYSH